MEPLQRAAAGFAQRSDVPGHFASTAKATGRHPVAQIAPAGTRAIPAHHQPIAIVLDFMNPERGYGSMKPEGRIVVMLPPRDPLCRPRCETMTYGSLAVVG